MTGGAGFIGSHLCERLLSDQIKVICLDNVDNFYDPNIKFTNAEGMAKKFPDLFELITWDIRNPYHLIGIFQKTKFDFVVHLAARAVVWPSNAETRSYQDVNIRGTIVLLEACKEHGINNFVFASLSVYRENQGDPFTEEDLGIQPISPCGATKRAGELFCCSYHHVYRDGSSRRDYTFC